MCVCLLCVMYCVFVSGCDDFMFVCVLGFVFACCVCYDFNVYVAVVMQFCVSECCVCVRMLHVCVFMGLCGHVFACLCLYVRVLRLLKCVSGILLVSLFAVYNVCVFDCSGCPLFFCGGMCLRVCACMCVCVCVLLFG